MAKNVFISVLVRFTVFVRLSEVKNWEIFIENWNSPKNEFRNRRENQRNKEKVKFKMAMLTDDEYKDLEAQIKLQEKVFLGFTRISRLL